MGWGVLHNIRILTQVNRIPSYFLKFSAALSSFPHSIPGWVALRSYLNPLSVGYEIDLDTDSDPGHDIFVLQPVPKCSERILFEVFIQASDKNVQQDFAKDRGLRS